VVAASVDRYRPKVNEREGKEGKRERSEHEGGKRWNLLKLSYASGREGGNGRESLTRKRVNKSNAWLTVQGAPTRTPYTGLFESRRASLLDLRIRVHCSIVTFILSKGTNDEPEGAV
jgi:hypothetical protein